MKKNKLFDLDFVGGGRPLTEEDKVAFSNFFRLSKSEKSEYLRQTKKVNIKKYTSAM